MTEKEIRDLFKTHGVPLGQTDVWTVQQALVVKHAALERLAATLGIVWDTPTVLRADRDEAVILASARRPDKDVAEWSIGEALVNVNYRVVGKMVAYVYAMAEKRAKDRVIIKLAGLHGAYSEDEADDFKAGNEKAPDAPAKALGPAYDEDESPYDLLRDEIDRRQTRDEITALMLDERTDRTMRLRMDDQSVEALKAYARNRIMEIGGKRALA